MKQGIHLSVIIPTYNEEKRIADTILDINKYLSKQNYTFEIIAVNDGSKDKTSDVLKQLESSVCTLRFIDNQKNRGKGAVVQQGMLSANGKYLIFVDADNAISIKHIENFWPYINGDYDVVIGSIEIEGSVKKEEYIGFSKIYRNVLGKLSKYLIRLLTVWSIHDTQRAFKLFRREAASNIFKRQTIMRWGFDIEVLVIARKLGYKVKELPVEWNNPPGRVNFWAYLKTLRELFQIKANLLMGKYGR